VEQSLIWSVSDHVTSLLHMHYTRLSLIFQAFFLIKKKLKPVFTILFCRSLWSPRLSQDWYLWGLVLIDQYLSIIVLIWLAFTVISFRPILFYLPCLWFSCLQLIQLFMHYKSPLPIIHIYLISWDSCFCSFHLLSFLGSKIVMLMLKYFIDLSFHYCLLTVECVCFGSFICFLLCL